jgi:glyoxylase-like metal-dependent hydrolase (beta-lactamase superfamily II)
MKPQVKAFFDESTNTVSYVVVDGTTRKCAIIDSVLDYDPHSGRTSHESANKIAVYVEREGLTVDWQLETHVHADHLSAAPYLQSRVGGKLGVGAEIVSVQSVFGDLFNVEPEFRQDGGQFDWLFADGAQFSVGSFDATAIHTPGHTPACMTYLIGDAAFVGDTLFMPDYGTARADFPGGDARELYRSIQKIFSLPDDTRLFMCHDYKSPTRPEFQWETTVGEQKKANIHVRDGVKEDDFVEMRTARDKLLGMPRLILPSVQFNMRGGNPPPPEGNGRTYLKIPLNAL